MGNWRELSSLYRMMGPLRFFGWFGLIGGVVVGYVVTEDWLAGLVGWSGGYGFQCIGRACLWLDVWYSYRLLQGGSGAEVALFAWIWLYPVVLLGPFLAVLVARWRRRRRHRIRPMD